MPANATSRLIARRITVFGGAQAFTVLAAVVRGKVAAFFVGAAGIGLNAVYQKVAEFIATVAAMGLSFSGIAALSADYASGDAVRLAQGGTRLRRLEVLLAAAGAVVTVAFAPWLSRHFEGDYAHTATYAALALVVAGLVVSGIELAIVKACQQTRRLAWASILSAALTVVLTVPFYIGLGLSGVIWALVACTVATAAMSLWFGHCTLPYRLSGGETWAELLRAARPMLTLGAVSLATGIAATGVDLVIQDYLLAVASKATVGLYRAGFQMGVGYVSMLFVAVANDYYPRLAAVAHDVRERNRLATRQGWVQLAFAAGAVALFEWLAPWLIPLFFSEEFAAAVPMARWAVVGTFFYALETPLNFLPVVLNRNGHYLGLELAGFVLMCGGAVGGYACGGLSGSGIGLMLARLLNWLLLYFFCRAAYGFRYR